MTRTGIIRHALAALIALLIAAPGVHARPAPYTQPELDQMLAPVALYPDALLSQVLMASTFPGEVVEAARWSRANPGLAGEDAVRAVEHEDWDPSVKSLVAFPDLIQRMRDDLDWTRTLGDAFLTQEPHVMETVQALRQRARTAGNLTSDARYRVQEDERVIAIEPADPRVVYVPYYDPRVVYGTWWWPAYPPAAWVAWRGYGYRPASPLWWGPPVTLSAGFFFGGVDWYQRRVRVVHTHRYPDRHRWHHGFSEGPPPSPGAWRPWHRQPTQARNPGWQRGSEHAAPPEARQAPRRDAPGFRQRPEENAAAAQQGSSPVASDPGRARRADTGASDRQDTPRGDAQRRHRAEAASQGNAPREIPSNAHPGFARRFDRGAPHAEAPARPAFPAQHATPGQRTVPEQQSFREQRAAPARPAVMNPSPIPSRPDAPPAMQAPARQAAPTHAPRANVEPAPRMQAMPDRRPHANDGPRAAPPAGAGARAERGHPPRGGERR